MRAPIPALLLVTSMVLGGPGLAEAEPSSAAESVLDVEAFMENVERHPANVRIRGIVVETRPEKQLFSLADLNDQEELLQTGKIQCGTLPVRWTGAMPGPRSSVIVEGRVEETDGRKLFLATSVLAETNEPPPEGRGR